jgi:hypothetical protein
MQTSEISNKDFLKFTADNYQALLPQFNQLFDIHLLGIFPKVHTPLGLYYTLCEYVTSSKTDVDDDLGTGETDTIVYCKDILLELLALGHALPNARIKDKYSKMHFYFLLGQVGYFCCVV